MAPFAETVALSHIEGVSDAARARELYKYYQPNSLNAIPENEFPERDNTISSKSAPSNESTVRSNISDAKKLSPDTCLTAFSQLVSWRLGVQRAMISLIDAEKQFFVAESTKTLDLNDSSRHAPGDDLWIGCGTVDKAGRLCERTIEVAPDPTGEYTAFIVNDLREDDRFNQLPFVTEAPFLKFYAGVPLITKRGIPIGSLFVVDDRVGNGLTKDEIHFMGTMAATTMRHLEMVREVEQHRRGMKMSRGLASFVEGRSELEEDEIDTGDQEGRKVAGQFETETTAAKSKASSIRGSRTGSVADSVKSLERKEKEYSKSLLRTEEAIMNSARKDETSSPLEPPRAPDTRPVLHDGGFEASVSSTTAPTDGMRLDAESPGSNNLSEISTMKLLFSRAANLIREAFEVDGGSVFYDAQKGFSSEFRGGEGEAENIAPSEDNQSDDSHLDVSFNTIAKDFAESGQPEKPFGSPPGRRGTFQRVSIASGKPVEILGFSTPGASSIHRDDPPGSSSFTPMDEESLHELMRRYPRGKLWTFDEDGCVSSSEEEGKGEGYAKRSSPGAPSFNRSRKQNRTAMEAKLLLHHFPGIRQMLFVPLWDASRSRWLSANFTWSNETTRILSKQGELAFLTAFGNSVMAECNRLDTEIADQKKGDFIGSISHELRSPLHGILASAEFLGEEVSEGFSKGLVETIDSCGRTLLDTINHILDFSKINHFEKNWRRSRRSGGTVSRPRDHVARQTDLPMINLFASIDVSIVCEEVVESVFAGHVFQNVTAPSFDLVAEPRGKMADPRKYHASSSDSVNFKTVSQNPEVAVIIDIDYEDYQFTTQPGAFRRVIMNLLGNALKYTSKGYVKVKLDVSEMEDLHPGTKDAVARSFINLTITDTGKGISAEFLRSKLFTAFAQENSLSSGTGLGLSIVRSIVALLEGEIQVNSDVGHGTEVKVTLPLLRDFPRGAESSGSTPKSIASVPREFEELIGQLRARTFGKVASLYGFDASTESPLTYQANQLLKASVQNFLSNWYGFKVVSYGERCDVVIANEVDGTTITKLTRRRSFDRRAPVVLSLCSHSSRFDRTHAIKESAKVGILAKPIGPLKLARALAQCLDGVPVTTPATESETAGLGISSETNDLTDKFEDLSLSPSGGEVLDNSRMAAGSDNARKAIESPTPNVSIEKQREFPFPESAEASIDSTIKGVFAKTFVPPPDIDVTPTRSTKVVESEYIGFDPPASFQPVMQSPRLLLVDDNKINLNLLRMYMVRRKYTRVKEAENGQEAVDAVRASPEGYDVIFMDISMPVLDGFGATRQIRQIELERREKALAEEKELPLPALVIALTGLASSRDQSEAFTSGIDLFLTKPVAFKEVGKMLDNWQANREREQVSPAGE